MRAWAPWPEPRWEQPWAPSPTVGRVPARARPSAASSVLVLGHCTDSTRTRSTTNSTARPTRAACAPAATPGSKGSALEVIMRRVMAAIVMTMFLALGGVPARAADDSKVQSATGQVENGAKKIGNGQVGQGVEETAKGVGNTVVEGAKYTGDKLK